MMAHTNGVSRHQTEFSVSVSLGKKKSSCDGNWIRVSLGEESGVGGQAAQGQARW